MATSSMMMDVVNRKEEGGRVLQKRKAEEGEGEEVHLQLASKRKLTDEELPPLVAAEEEEEEGGSDPLSARDDQELVFHEEEGMMREELEELGVLGGISLAEIKKAVKEYVRERGVLPTYTDPCKDSPYPEVPDLPNAYCIYQLRHGGMTDSKRKHAIAVGKARHAKYRAKLLGYQCNQKLRFQRDFGSYLNMHTNNIGDTFKEGSFTLSSKYMERAVLDYYAELWHAQYPHADKEPESYWGFCLSMGCTEGNMYGMWNARDYLSGKKILIDNTTSTLVKKTKEGTSSQWHQLPMLSVKDKEGGTSPWHQLSVPRFVYHSAPTPDNNDHAYTPIAFFSEDSHYSISKTMTMLNLRTFHTEGKEHYDGLCPLEGLNGEWPADVPSHESGAMDIDALAILVEFFAARGYPIVVCFNYGTTFKGAYDDVADACNKLRPILQKYGLLVRKVHYDKDDPSKFDVRTGYWFHVDGALGAAYMPYIEMAFNAGLVEKKGPTFDFRLPMVHSIAMSGHKWIGAPYPCGVFMTRTKYQMLPPTTPTYVGTPDTTFAGSRNGLSPMFLWDYIARNSYTRLVVKALYCEILAAYAETRLLYLQKVVLQEDLYVARTPLALTVRFKRANAEICLKYTLSNEDLHGRRYSHIFAMEHVTHKLIDALIEDLSKPGAFDDGATPFPWPIPPITDAAVLAPRTGWLDVIPSQGRGFRG